MTRFGFQLPTFDPLGVGGPQRFVEAAKLAEAAGFDAVWTGDHLASPAPNYEASVVVAAAAAVTDRIDVGFSVMLLGLREPAWAAKQLQAIDAIAPGRLRLGVGVGGEFPDEFEAVGLSSRVRGKLLDRGLEVLPDLLAGAPVEVGGLKVPALTPPVSVLPPIYVGGRGEPALERAGRVGDWWMPLWLTPDKLVQRGERLGELAAQRGRPTPKIAIVQGAHVDEDEARARRKADEYTQGMYGMGLERVERWTAFGSAGRVAEFVEGLIGGGCEEVIFTLMSDEPLTQIDRLAEVRDICCAG